MAREEGEGGLKAGVRRQKTSQKTEDETGDRPRIRHSFLFRAGSIEACHGYVVATITSHPYSGSVRFAALALVLSALGLYSVVAYLVSQRTAEIGIRMALGAQPAQVVGLVLRSGLKLVVIGLLLGLAGAAGTARAIQTLLFQVRPLDPVIYAVVAALFTIVATLACLVPSWRASRIDPLIALRAE